MTDQPDERARTPEPDGEVRAADRVASAASLSGERVAQISTILRRQIKLARRRTQKAQTSAWPLLRWGQTYLPRHFRLEPSLMHRWLEAQLGSLRDRRGMKLNVVGPRGGAKSTIGTLAWPLRAAVEGREPYIWIVSDTSDQAIAHLSNIKTELLENSRLAESYPQATGQGRRWQSSAITLRNGVAIEAYGTGQSVRGRRRGAERPTLIICDDLENDQHIESPRMREQSRNWFHSTLLKAGAPQTNILNLATALHREALAMQLALTPGWMSKLFRAIEQWPDNMLRWQEWEVLYSNLEDPEREMRAQTFYDEHRAEMDAGAVLLWPERENLYALMCMRAESGRTSFEREKQCSPINSEACEWPEAYFESLVWFDQWPRRLRVKTIALDPSKGNDARHGDYSAFVLLGVDDQGLLYVEADLARRPTPQIVADGVELYRGFRPDALGIEANQFQDLLGEAFTAEFRRQGLLTVNPWLLSNQVNKAVRIRRLGPHLAAGRIRFKAQSSATRLLVDQLREFPLADHDDGPDALEMALRLAAELLATPAKGDGLGSRLLVGT